jgi:hypothetical protein
MLVQPVSPCPPPDTKACVCLAMGGRGSFSTAPAERQLQCQGWHCLSNPNLRTPSPLPCLSPCSQADLLGLHHDRLTSGASQALSQQESGVFGGSLALWSWRMLESCCTLPMPAQSWA